MSAAGPRPLGRQGFVDAWAPIFFSLAMDGLRSRVGGRSQLVRSEALAEPGADFRSRRRSARFVR
jgi:hypothetical protein